MTENRKPGSSRAFCFTAPKAETFQGASPCTVLNQETSDNDAISRKSNQPAKVHPTSIVKLALNRFIIAVFMVLYASVRCCAFS